MMRTLALLGLVAVAVTLCAAQQRNPPNVAGRWDAASCSLVPDSDQLYLSRTWVYSRVNGKSLNGTYQRAYQFFTDPSCAARLELYRIIETGTFTFGGRANIERFWKLNYNMNTRTLQVFSTAFNTLIAPYVGCDLPGPWVPNVEVDVSAHSCVELNIESITECPVEYNVARREGNLLYTGAIFRGDPLVYQSLCRSIDRPLEYDRFFFNFFVAAPVPNPNQVDLPDLVNGDAAPFDPVNYGLPEPGQSASAASALLASVAAVVLATVAAIV